MFIIPGIAALLAFVYIRPQEIFEVLRPITLGHVLALMAVGYLIDLRVGVTRLRSSPLRALSLAFFAWSFLALAVKAPAKIDRQLPLRAGVLVVFIAISEGIQRLRGLGVVASATFAISLFLAAAGLHQGLAEPLCVDRRDDLPELTVTDGRHCETIADCNEGGTPGVEYLCEHPGWFGTHSIDSRVRFRGILQDPNELAWAVGLTLPFAFMWYERKRSVPRLLSVLVVVGVTTACVIMTKSRSGQLSLPAVVIVYFFRRFGVRGIVVAAILSIPIMVLGGRGGEAAESSSIERLECWSTALDMWRENPFMGVGMGQFTEHHYLTAHNSFLLLLAELGPIGLFLWMMVIYLAIKISLRVQLDFATGDGGRPRLGAGPDGNALGIRRLRVLSLAALSRDPLDRARPRGRAVCRGSEPRSKLAGADRAA